MIAEQLMIHGLCGDILDTADAFSSLHLGVFAQKHRVCSAVPNLSSYMVSTVQLPGAGPSPEEGWSSQ